LDSGVACRNHLRTNSVTVRDRVNKKPATWRVFFFAYFYCAGFGWGLVCVPPLELFPELFPSGKVIFIFAPG
jgi:hypothetical protein